MIVDDRLRGIQNGTDYRLYEYLGCHQAKKGGKDGA